jgi:phosphatidylserine/phosphatidylglycerophosphate/cardiolipin synthase-like enzyme
MLALVCTASVAPAAATAGDATGGNGPPPTATPDDASHAMHWRSNGTPAVVAGVPNPVADGDTGEFVVVYAPGTSANWTLGDGESRVALPTNRSAATVAVSPDPAAARETARVPVVAGALALSNQGERLRLRRNGTVLAAFDYEDAPEGERFVRTDGELRWRPVGLRPRSVHEFGAATVTGFVLPDSPDHTVATLRDASDRLLLAGYTFTDRRIADALVAAERRGVRVRVLLDADPVGGMSTRQAATLDRLTAAGVDVGVLGGPRARFDYHHPKYAVVDDRAVVLTENWKPSGVGGASSRGWGLVVDSAAVADDLAALFGHDAGGPDVTPWRRFRRGEAFERSEAARGSYPSQFDPVTARASTVRVLTAPGNAETGVVAVIDAAEDRVDVVQSAIGRRDGPLLGATIRAAQRGVRVRVLLSGAWYAVEENRRLAEWLNRVADSRDLPLAATVADPAGRFEKIHAKGVIADDVVVVGSLNWNGNAVSENREVAVAVRSERVAARFREVYAADWNGSGSGGRRTWVVAAGAAAALVLAVLVARRTVAFD